MDHRKMIDCCFLQQVKKFKLELDMSSLTVLIKSLISEARSKKRCHFQELYGYSWRRQSSTSDN